MRSASVLAFSLSLAFPLAAQTVPDGYADTVTALPPGAHAVAVVERGLLWFDGTALVIQEPAQPLRTLLQFPSPRFGAFTRPVLDGSAVVFGESSMGEIWHVPLDPMNPPSLVTMLNLPYDAVPLSHDRFLVSAKTGGFGASVNDLVAVNLNTGATVTIATLPGASGPLLRLDDGSFVYATAPLAFPPNPGTVDVLQFGPVLWARPLAGGAPLAAAEATLLVTGLDTAGQLILDDDDDLIYSDWFNNVIGEIHDLHGAATRSDLLDYSTAALSPANVLWLPAPTGGAFEPYAGPTAGTLVLHETDFFSTDQLRFLDTAPAVLTTPGGVVPMGAVSIDVTEAAPNGLLVMAFTFAAANVAVPLAVPGVEEPLLWDAAMFHPLATRWLLLDGQGAANVVLFNPGTLAASTLHVQCAFLSANAEVAGATALGTVLLGQ